MSGAYADAMERKLHELLDWWEQQLNTVGLTCAPRVLGPHCPWPRETTVLIPETMRNVSRETFHAFKTR